MTRATQFQKDFAKSRMEYFKNELGSGKGDAVKPFVKALVEKTPAQSDWAADKVMTSVNTAKTQQKSVVDNEKILAQIVALPTTYDGTKKCEKAGNVADKLVGLCTGDEELMTFFNAIYESQTDYTAVTVTDQIQKLLDQKPAGIIDDAPVGNAVDAYVTSAGASTDPAQIANLDKLAKVLGMVSADGTTNTAGVLFVEASGAYDGTTVANNNKGFTDLGTSDAEKVTRKTAAIEAYLGTTNAFYKTNDPGASATKGDAVKIKGDTISKLFTQAEAVLIDAKTIAVTDTAISGQTAAKPVYDALFGEVAKTSSYTYTGSKKPSEEIDTAKKAMVADAPKDKAVLDSWNALSSKFGAKTQEGLTKAFAEKTFNPSTAGPLYTTGMKEVLKGYDFINKILTNIPSKGGTSGSPLTPNDGNPFTKFVDGIGGKGDAIVKAAQFYLELVTKVCGVAPFNWDEITKDLNQDTQKCATQIATISAIILNDVNCGSDKLENGAIKDACYEGIVSKLGDAWLKAEELKVALESEYQDDILHYDLQTKQLNKGNK